MPTKRAYSAYLATSAAATLPTAHGFDPVQPQQSTPSSSPRLPIPGAWEEEEEEEEEEDIEEKDAPTDIFTTLGRWAATVSLTNLLSLPARLANRFLRRQAIKAIPLISSAGSNKRRFVAAGLADEQVATPSPSVRARAQKARRRHIQHETRASNHSPWTLHPHDVAPQTRHATFAPSQFTSYLSDTQVMPDLETSPNPVYDPENHLDQHGHVSIDFSFDDILTSTPPRNSQTGSPVHVSWHSPQAHTSTSHLSSLSAHQTEKSPTSSWNLPQSPASVGRVQGPVPPRTTERTAPCHDPRRAYCRATRLPSTTPMRRQLVKLQFGAEYRRFQATRQAEPQKESADQGFAETESAKITPTNAVNQDLSYLSDASSPSQVEAHSEAGPASNNTNHDPAVSEFEYDNDLSFLLDAPSLPPRKGVRWTRHAGAKPFYYDEKVTDMLDSTLEIINSSPVRGFWHNFQSDEQATSNNSNDDNSPSSSAATSPRTAAKHTQVDHGGFRGVPPDTFDTSDDSLEESQLSLQLVADLQNELKTKLALAPPPPPPPKPLVTPLSDEELETLHATAANTSNGRKADKWVIEQKLYARDFATLLPHLFNGDPRAWLNDNIVNEYLAILVAAKKKEAGFQHQRGGPAPPVHAFSSFWYSTADTSRWTNRFQLKGKQYLDADLILYPICDRGHWRLLAVYPKKRAIEYLDSMDLDGQKYMDKLVEYLSKELGSLYVEDEWTKDRVQRSSQQLNGSDCGVFTLLNALALLRGDDTKLVLPTNGMDDARKRIAATLLAGRPTTEWE